MRSLERRERGESLDALIAAAARTYGFTNPPVSLTRNDLAGVPDDVDRDTALVVTLAARLNDAEETTQVWATAKKSGGTAVVFAAASQKISIAQAFVVKAAIATAESAGFSDPTVLISSVGDQESRRRYARELGSFFKKYAKDMPEEIFALSAKNPDGAAQTLLEKEHPLSESLPRTIDYLSESSRKIMLETISLFEELGIRYELDARLPYTPRVNHELVFAVIGMNRKGESVRVACGGRVEPATKKKDGPELIGMSVFVPREIDAKKHSAPAIPACFVVHIGEAAKLKAFTLLDSLWRAHVAIGQALMEETMQKQLTKANESKAKYFAIIGVREALDNTVIVKNVSTQLQETIPADKLIGRMSRVRV